MDTTQERLDYATQALKAREIPNVRACLVCGAEITQKRLGRRASVCSEDRKQWGLAQAVRKWALAKPPKLVMTCPSPGCNKQFIRNRIDRVCCTKKCSDRFRRYKRKSRRLYLSGAR